MIIHDMPQGSPEWKLARLGKPSASNFSRIITAAKADLSKAGDDYLCQLIGECVAPDWVYWEGNKATERGTALEPEARAAFGNHTGLLVKEVGFITRDDGVIGCSPDGLIYDDADNLVAGLEIKCPSPKEFVSYQLDGVLPEQYKQQLHGGMAVTGLDQWHFFAYFPGLKPFHLIVQRDEYTEKLSAALDIFLGKYQTAYAKAMALLK